MLSFYFPSYEGQGGYKLHVFTTFFVGIIPYSKFTEIVALLGVTAGDGVCECAAQFGYIRHADRTQRHLHLHLKYLKL